MSDILNICKDFDGLMTLSKRYNAMLKNAVVFQEDNIDSLYDDKTDTYDIMGVIGLSTNEEMLAEAIRRADGEMLNIRLNSPGGSYFKGITMFNMLDSYEGGINTTVLGEASSAASVISLSGDTLPTMLEGSLFMIHNASGLAIGDAKTLREFADVYEKMSSAAADLYETKNSVLSREDIIEKMNAETFFTRKEAIKNGFARKDSSDSRPKNDDSEMESRETALMERLMQSRLDCLI